MTTETTERAVPRNVPTPMPVGGAVVPIVPQSFEEIQRVSNTVITGGLAPSSLIKWPGTNDDEATIRDIGRRNVAAVAGVLMAGAELGVPPMAALRMFTSINGRPALYADGNVAVVRRARDRDAVLICEYIRQGYVEVCDFICPECGSVHKTEGLALTHFVVKHKDIKLPDGVKLEFEQTEPTDRSYAWCEAKRADNGEIHHEEFSIADAKRAGLWDAAEFKRAKVWRNGKQDWYDDVPNDSAWHRYPRRMMLWRATGYCLRWLFADVLAGMVDEFEAREIEGFVDITPSQPQIRQQQSMPPTPPPEEDENQDAQEEGKILAEAAALHNSDQPAGAENEGDGATEPASDATDGANSATKTAESATNDDMPPAPPVDDDKPEPEPKPGTDEWFAKLELLLAADQTEDAIEDTWNALDVDSVLSDTSEATMDRAHALKQLHLARIGGQGDLLG